MYNVEDLMKDYGNDVLRMAYSYMRDYHLAEDIFQDVFLKVSQKIDSFHGESQIKTWLLRITINTCKDYQKSAYQRRVVPGVNNEDTFGEESKFEEVENYDRNKLIMDSILNLPLKYREILLCVYYYDLAVTETAKLLKIPEGTAKSRLKRGRDKLKVMLEGRL